MLSFPVDGVEWRVGVCAKQVLKECLGVQGQGSQAPAFSLHH